MRSIARRVLAESARSCDRVAALFRHAGTGLLTRDELEAECTQYWGRFGRAIDDQAAHLEDWEEQFYGAHLRPQERVLIVGAGSGRELLALSARGFRVDGVEPNQACAERARRAIADRAVAADLVVDRAETMTLSKTYDVVVFSWFCLSYILRKQARASALERSCRQLTDGGRILVSYVVAQNSRSPIVNRVTNLVARANRSGWQLGPGDHVSATEHGLALVEHRFSTGELEAEAKQAGLCITFQEERKIGLAVLTPPLKPGLPTSV